MPLRRKTQRKRKKRKRSLIDRWEEEQRAEDYRANEMVKLKEEGEAADASYGPDGTTKADL